MGSWIVSNSKRDLICRLLSILHMIAVQGLCVPNRCMWMCVALWRTGKGGWQVVVSGWWDVMCVWTGECQLCPVTLVIPSASYTHRHTGVFPSTHYTSETNQGWTAALINFISAFCLQSFLILHCLFYNVPTEHQLVTDILQSYLMYHWANIMHT